MVGKINYGGIKMNSFRIEPFQSKIQEALKNPNQRPFARLLEVLRNKENLNDFMNTEFPTYEHEIEDLKARESFYSFFVGYYRNIGELEKRAQVIMKLLNCRKVRMEAGESFDKKSQQKFTMELV